MVKLSAVYGVYLIAVLFSLCVVFGAIVEENEFDGVKSVRSSDATVETSNDETVTVSDTIRPKSGFRLNGDISGLGTYMFEMLLCGLVVCYLVCHVIGRAANRNIIQNWLSQCDTLLQKEFAATGAPDTAHSSAAKDRYFQESAREYTYYASGRQNISSIYLKFNLKHRHDLLMWMVDTILYPVEDQLTIEMVLPSDRKCDPALIAFLKKSKVVSFREEHSSFKDIITATQLSGLQEGVVVLAESAETAKELIPESVIEIINENMEYFQSLYVTDVNSTVPQGYTEIYPNIVYCTVKLPKNSKDTVSFINMLLKLADHLANVKLSMVAKGRVDKNRRLMKEQIEKLQLEKAKEALEQKKLEKTEKEKMLYETLSPQEKARIDEKEEKKKKKAEDKKKFKLKKK